MRLVRAATHREKKKLEPSDKQASELADPGLLQGLLAPSLYTDR